VTVRKFSKAGDEPHSCLSQANPVLPGDRDARHERRRSHYLLTAGPGRPFWDGPNRQQIDGHGDMAIKN